MIHTKRSRLYRHPDQGWVAGVCAGLAEYFDFSVRWIRVIAVLGLIFGGIFPVLLLYFACWYAMEAAPSRQAAERRDETAPRPWSLRTDNTPSVGSTPEALDHTFARLERRLRHLEAGVTAPEFELKRALRELEREKS